MLKIFKKKNSRLSFIFGCPRGGTTFLWSLLESHPNVVPFTKGVKDAEGKYTTSESGIYINNRSKAKKEILNFSLKHNGYLIIEKTPLHTLRYQDIKKDFPNSKDIVILRNPLAIVNSMCSSKMVAFEDYDMDKAILEVKKYFNALHVIIESNNCLIVTYENLLKNTEQELLKVVDYLGIENHDLKRIISENKNTTKVSVSGAFRKGKVDSFNEDLSEKQILEINEKLKNETVLFNRYN